MLIAEERQGLHLLESVFHWPGQTNLIRACWCSWEMTWIVLLSPLFLLAMSEHAKEAIQLLLFSLRLFAAIKLDSVRFMWIYVLLYTEQYDVEKR